MASRCKSSSTIRFASSKAFGSISLTTSVFFVIDAVRIRAAIRELSIAEVRWRQETNQFSGARKCKIVFV
jgi:hypothetical protein